MSNSTLTEMNGLMQEREINIHLHINPFGKTKQKSEPTLRLGQTVFKEKTVSKPEIIAKLNTAKHL